jgi:hypothetical protein
MSKPGCEDLVTLLAGVACIDMHRISVTCFRSMSYVFLDHGRNVSSVGCNIVDDEAKFVVSDYTSLCRRMFVSS